MPGVGSEKNRSAKNPSISDVPITEYQGPKKGSIWENIPLSYKFTLKIFPMVRNKTDTGVGRVYPTRKTRFFDLKWS